VQGAPRVSGATSDAPAVKRSTSDSAVEIQPTPTCCHGDETQSRDANNVGGSGPATDDVTADDALRPLAVDSEEQRKEGTVLAVNSVSEFGSGSSFPASICAIT